MDGPSYAVESVGIHDPATEIAAHGSTGCVAN
jgi:hypothetical protein